MQAEKLALLQSVSVDLERDGFAKVKGVFDQKIVDMIRFHAYETLSKKDAVAQWVGKHPALLFWPDNQFLRSIARANVMKDIVCHILGPDVRQLNNQIYFREAGDGDSFAWHQDLCFRTPASDYAEIETSYLQTVIVVDEITRHNGAVEFIPGSHKLGNLNLIPRDNTERGLRNFDRGMWRGVKVEAEPGDVILWSVMTVHGSEENRTESNRLVYMNGFAKESAVLNKKAWPIYNRGEQ